MTHLSPRRFALALGVSESSVKRWVDAGRIATSLTAGGHRRIPLAAAVRFVRESGADLADPSALGLPELAASADLGSAELLHGHVLQGRPHEAVALVRGLYVAGRDVAWIIDEPFRSAMDRVGELWHGKGEQGVFLEHRATQIAVRILHELRAMQPPPADSAPVALGGAPEGDPYLLPSLAAATVLEAAGFATTNLGPQTPDGAFTSAIESLRPSLAWLSVTAVRKRAERERTLRVVGEAIEQVGGRLVLGGQASEQLSLDGFPSGFRCSSMVELAAFASGVRSAPVRA